MLVLALRTDPARVYERARGQFTDQEIAEAFAATRGLTMPTQLRRLMRQQGRDLHAEFLPLLPYRLPPVRIQLWSMRRVLLTIGTLLGGAAGGGDPDERPRAAAVRRARAVRTTRALPALVAGGMLAGCASDSTAIMTTPLCENRGGGADNSVILMAQSVPTATQVPCISAALPLGWGFHHLDARNGVSRFWLDSDRDGQQAIEVRLTESCDTSGTTEVPTDREGMQRLERVDRLSPSYAGVRYYLFDGGCMSVVFALDGHSAGEALAVASDIVGVVARADLDRPGATGERGPALPRPRPKGRRLNHDHDQSPGRGTRARQ